MARKTPLGFYLGASDAMSAPFEPKTPCRNMSTRPCVWTSKDDRTLYPENECPHHHCARFDDEYEEGKIPHEFKLKNGVIENFDLGDIHDGPYCVRCKMYFCRNCSPKIYTEICEIQDLHVI